jgi:hypothetical protein
LISALAAISTTLFSNWNTVELEKLKIESKELEIRRAHFDKRCSSMNALLKEMTLNMQNLYYGNESGKIDKTLDRISILRSNATLAKSYFGDNATNLYAYGMKDIEERKSKGESVSPEAALAVSITALSEELKSCNSPEVFPKLEQ